LYSYAFSPNGGGVGSYLANMADALAGAGQQVVVLTGQVKGLPAEERRGNITILRQYHPADIGSRRVTDLALSVISRYQIDLVEGADYLGDCARLLHEKERPPVLIKVHSCNILKILNESQVMYWWQRPLIRLALLRNWKMTRREKSCIERADLLVAPSTRILAELDRQDVRLPRARTVIANPIRPSGCSFADEASSPTLLMVCRLDIGKGIQYVPRMIATLRHEFPDLRLEIAGSDAYARGLGSLKGWLLKQLGSLASQVTFLGQLDSAALEAAYKRAWAVVLPSRWDNFPTVVLEAMSYGKAVVASPHGGMPEMLEGTLCSTADPASEEFIRAISVLLRQVPLRKAAGRTMFDKARRAYAPEVVAAAYLDFVEENL